MEVFLEEREEAELAVPANAERNVALLDRHAVKFWVHGALLFTEKRLEICRASISSSEVKWSKKLKNFVLILSAKNQNLLIGSVLSNSNDVSFYQPSILFISKYAAVLQSPC